MLLKRKILVALDKFEDQEIDVGMILNVTRLAEGIVRAQFIPWLQQSVLSKKYTRSHIDKCINDCIEDGYIKQDYADGELVPVFNDSQSALGVLSAFGTPTGFKRAKVEQISLTSKGREMIKWHFFIPAVIEKMSIKEILLFALTTAILIILGYLGVSHLPGQ